MGRLSKKNESMKKSNHYIDVTTGDRLTSAVLSALFAGLTLIGYAFFVRYDYLSLNLFLTRRQLLEILSSHTSLYILGGSSILGFVLGPTRMGEVFGFFWGTNDSNASNHSGWIGNALGMLTVIAVAVIAWRTWR